jgi:hypothetical protein
LLGLAVGVGTLAVSGPVAAIDDWARPVTTLSNASLDASAPQIAVDPNGNAMAVWVRNGVVEARRYSNATRTWEAAATALSASGASAPQVAIDANGNAIAVWLRADVVESRRHVGGTWASMVQVSDNVVPGPPATGVAQTPRIASTPNTTGGFNDDMMVVWRSDAQIKARRFDGTAWSAITDVSSVVDTAEAPQVAFDNSGEARAVWRRQFDPTPGAPAPLDTDTVWRVQSAATSGGGNTWGAGIDVPNASTGTDGFNAQIAVEPSGAAVIVWNQGPQIVKSSRFASGSWSATPATVIEDGQNNTNPQLAVDSNGVVTVIWEGSVAPHQVVKTARLTGSTWGAPTVLAAPGVDSFSPRIVARAQGFATAIWWRGTAGPEGGALQASTYVPTTATWDAPVDLATGVPFANSGDTDVAIDSVGRAQAVWVTKPGATTVVQTSNSGNLAWVDQDLGPIRINVAYNDGVSASAVGVSAPTYSITAGALPGGLSLNGTTGVITGTATAFGAYSFTITANNGVQQLSKTFSGNIRSGFTPLTPARVLDTRPGESPNALLTVPKQPIGGSTVLRVPMTNLPGGRTPATGVGAVSLNVTVTNPVASGFLTAYPCGDVPFVSNVNFVAGQTVPNAVIAPLSAAGELCFFSNVQTDVIVDINGWFLSNTGFTSVTPARVFDSRPSQSPNALVAIPKQKYGGDRGILQVNVVNLAGATPASGVGAVSLNVTVTNPEAAGFLTVYPCGGSVPQVSNVNFVAGQSVPNAVITPVPANGLLCFFSNVPTDIIADINGWFSTANTGFNTVAPTRVFDTRPGESPNAVRTVDKRKVGGGYVLEVTFTGLPGGLTPASGVGAVSLNLTATNPDAAGFVTAFPCGTTPPFVSNLNFRAGQTVANAALATLSADGKLCFFSNVPTDIIADINGWFV